jgi:hypothetical protein
MHARVKSTCNGGTGEGNSTVLTRTPQPKQRSYDDHSLRSCDCANHRGGGGVGGMARGVHVRTCMRPLYKAVQFLAPVLVVAYVVYIFTVH